MSWYVHLRDDNNPPMTGTQNGLCGKEVKDAQPRYDEIDNMPRICADCEELARLNELEAGVQRYFWFLIPGESAKQEGA